jgi:hypothetical protein
MSCQDLAIEIQKTGFDDAGNRIRVNFRKGVILAHVGGDAARVKRKACGVLITVHEAGCEAAGAVGIARVKRRGYFKARGLFINKITRVVVDGYQSDRTIAVEARIELVEQVHLKALCVEFLLNEGRDL